MLPKNRIPTHPGEILLEDFLKPLGVSQVALAEHLDIPVQRINELVRGKRGVTPETAWLLAGALGTTPEFWINLADEPRPGAQSATEEGPSASGCWLVLTPCPQQIPNITSGCRRKMDVSTCDRKKLL